MKNNIITLLIFNYLRSERATFFQDFKITEKPKILQI